MTTPEPPPAETRAASADIQLDPGDAYQAVRELETARAELLSIREEARDLAEVNPTARDEVSRDAALASAASRTADRARSCTPTRRASSRSTR